jgi:hypothetical protein
VSLLYYGVTLLIGNKLDQADKRKVSYESGHAVLRAEGFPGRARRRRWLRESSQERVPRREILGAQGS